MAYKIRIAICGIEPPIWRSLRIPGSITFAQLHRIIQVAFGWLDYHLYHFRFGSIVVVEPDPDFSPAELYGEDAQALDPGETLVSQLFDEHDRCGYEYDFGDSWVHEIVVEKRLKDTNTCRRAVLTECYYYAVWKGNEFGRGESEWGNGDQSGGRVPAWATGPNRISRHGTS